MALAFGTIGTATTTGTTAPTVAYPASIAAGDLLILAIANRPSASTPATPSGWTAHSNYTTTGGAGSEGADTGIVRITVFTKVADGSETGSLSLTLTGGTSVGARMWRVTAAAGSSYDIACAIGSDNTAGTSWSVTFGSDPGVTSGDLVFVCSGSSNDGGPWASELLAQTGVTYGTMVEHTDTGISIGNDCHLTVSEHPASSGTSSAAGVYTATTSGPGSANNAGASIMIRVRESFPALTATLTATQDDNTLASELFHDREASLTATQDDNTLSATAQLVADTLLSDLVSHFRLNAHSGVRIDSHGTNHLTDNNTVGTATGLIGPASHFVAVNNEFLSLADNAPLSMGAGVSFTIAGWFKLSSTTTATGKTIIGKYDTSGNQREYAILVEWSSGLSNARLEFAVSSDGTAGNTTILRYADIGTPAVGTWYFFIARCNTATNTISLQVNDGALESVAHTGGCLNGTSNFNIGALDGMDIPSYMFDGDIQAISIWKRVLTLDEGTALYNSGAGIPYESYAQASPTPWGSFDFEGTGWPATWWAGGAADPDYTVSPISGAQSLRVFNDGTAKYGVWQPGVDKGEVWGRFRIRIPTLSSSVLIGVFDDLAFSGQISLGSVFADGSVSLNFSNTLAAGSIVAGTDYYVWWHYRRESATGVFVQELWIGTSSNFKNATLYLGDESNNLTRYFGQLNLYPENGVEKIYDDVEVWDAHPNWDGLSTVNASLTATQDDQTVSSTSTVDIVASLTATQDGQTSSSTAEVSLSASATLTQDDNSSSSTATVDLVASLTATQDDNTLSSNIGGSLLPDLAAHWKLNEASGTRSDSHGTNHLTDNNTVVSTTGKIGDAALFEDTNLESLSIPDNASLKLSADQPLTIAAWVNLASKPANVMGIATKGPHTTLAEYVLVWNNTTDRFSFTVSNGSSNAVVSSGAAPTLSTWHLVIAWHDPVSDTLKISVDNGTADSVAWAGGTFIAANIFYIGRRQFGQYFDGAIDSVSIWKRVLTDSERTALYNSGAGLDYEAFNSNPEVTASLTATQDDNTVSSTATVGVSSSVNATQSDQTLVSNAEVALNATASPTQDDNTLSANASVGDAPRDASLNVTQDDNTLVATSEVSLSASATVTQADNTVSGSATVDVSASLTATQADNTVTSSAVVGIAASVTATQDGNTSSSTATVDIVASVNATQGDQTLIASIGSGTVLFLSITQDDNALSSSATVDIVASVNVTQDDSTSSSTATVSLSASVTANQGDNTPSSTVGVLASASLTATQEDQTLNSNIGLVGEFTLNVTQDNNSCSSNAVVDVQASVIVSATGDSLSSNATVSLSADVTANQESNSLSSTAGVSNSASLTSNQDENSIVSNAQAIASASLVATQADNSLDGNIVEGISYQITGPLEMVVRSPSNIGVLLKSPKQVGVGLVSPKFFKVKIINP